MSNNEYTLEAYNPFVYEMVENFKRVAKAFIEIGKGLTAQCAIIVYPNNATIRERKIIMVPQTNEFMQSNEEKEAFPVFIQLLCADLRKQKFEIEAVVMWSDAFLSKYDVNDDNLDDVRSLAYQLEPRDDPFRQEVLLFNVAFADRGFLISEVYKRTDEGKIEWEAPTIATQESHSGRFADLYPHGAIEATPETFRRAIKKHPIYETILKFAPSGLDVDAMLERVFLQLANGGQV